MDSAEKCPRCGDTLDQNGQCPWCWESGVYGYDDP
jgi:hypothetical protein